MKDNTSVTFKEDGRCDPMTMSFPDIVFYELQQRFGLNEKIRYPAAREFLGRRRNFRKAEVRAAIFFLVKNKRILAKPKFFRLLPAEEAE